jgi:RNA polymerase sigma-70 factor, ECF subfamily
MTKPAEYDHADQAWLLRTVSLARAGDDEAMEALATRALTRARTVTRVMLDGDEAMDVAQDAVIDALRGLPKLREPVLFDAWVTRIATRRVVKAKRRTATHQPAFSLDDPVSAKTLAADGDSSVGVDARELRDALRLAIRSLPREQGMAIALRYFFDFSEAQIADALGKKLSAASVLLVRARRGLADHPAIAALAPDDNRGAS